MKKLVISIFVLLVLSAMPASAACYADYKAKKDDPLRLHYGVIELADTHCANKEAAAGEVRRRISSGGWTLLSVVSIFAEDGLDRRRESAADFFLRF